METNTKLLRIESVVDRCLAWVIGLPAPFTFVAVVAWTVGCVALGAWLS